MTPVFLNPPSSPFADLVEQKDQDHQQLKIFINSQYNYEASSSLSSPTNYFFNSSPQDQSSDVIGSQQHDDQKVVIDVSSSTGSQNLSTCQRDQDNINGDQDQYNLSNNNKNMNNGSVKYWMSSKMRLMQKMSNPESSASTITDDKRDKKVLHSSCRQDNFFSEAMFKFSPGNNSTTANTAIRVCSDCNTTTTPLWRSGPRGPKSLCNACGIRQRKARRAMAEAAAAAAANGLAFAPDSSTTGADYYKTQYHTHREKKSRGNHNISHCKNKLKLKLKLVDSSSTASPKSENNNNNNNNNNNIISSNNLRKFSFGLNNDNYCSAFSGVFPKDVAEAAVLLMELSCGFV